MRLTKQSFVLIVIVISLLFGCNYEFPTQPESPNPIGNGKDKVANFVVLGGSISSGIMDGAFHKRGQKTAYPNLIGARLDTLIEGNVYGLLSTDNTDGYNLTESQPNNPKSKYRLSYREIDSDFPARKYTEGESVDVFDGSIDTVNNFSIPEIRSYQLLNSDSLSGNVFYERFASQLSEGSLVETIINKNPSLILLSIGVGDIYPFILNGASGRINPPEDDIRENDATPLDLFEQSVNSTVEEILNNTQADIVLPTIINPMGSFYFNTLKWHFSESEISGQLAIAISHYHSFNEDVQEFNNADNGMRRPVIVFDFEPGKQYKAKVFVDDLLPYAEANDGSVIPKFRQMTNGEFMLYSAEKTQYNSINGDKEFATTEPADDKYVITVKEMKIIDELLRDYNNVLQSLANSYDRVKLLDLHSFFEDVKKGRVSYDGVVFNTSYAQNTVISSDGYSLNSKGQALMANELLNLLNNNYGTNFKLFNVNNFQGNQVIVDS